MFIFKTEPWNKQQILNGYVFIEKYSVNNTEQNILVSNSRNYSHLYSFHDSEKQHSIDLWLRDRSLNKFINV